MADVKWIKIVTDIFDDEKILLIESLPEADAIIVLWFKLLCLAGKQNNQGVFLLNNRIPYTDEMLATIFRRNVATVRLALNTFENFGMIEIVNGVITIPNWDKHQSLDALEKKRAYHRELMRKLRAEQKALCESHSEGHSENHSEGHVTTVDKIRIEEEKNKNRDNNIIVQESSEKRVTQKQIKEDFEYLWSLYPKKRGKDKALAAYKRAIEKGETTKEEVEAGIKAYIEYINKSRTESQYIKNGSTYFNGGCWKDDYELSGVNNNDGIFNEFGGISNAEADYRELDRKYLV